MFLEFWRVVCPCPERKARPEIGREGCPEIVRIGRVVCPHNGRVCPEARVYQRKDLKGKDLFLEFGRVVCPCPERVCPEARVYQVTTQVQGCL